jgi:putative ABC transport system permease protein
MLIGMDFVDSSYQASFHLTDGEYFTGKGNEILLMDSHADQLKVVPGDTVTALCQSKAGYMVEASMRVAGIGTIDLLSMPGIDIGYTDLNTARDVMGESVDAATELLVFLPDKSDVDHYRKRIASLLRERNVSVSSYKEMGSLFMGIVEIIGILFHVFLLFLMMITIILIFNLVYQSSIERFQEIGTLRAIGFSRTRVASLLLSEILIVTSFFSSLGLLGAYGLVMLFSKYGLPQHIEAWRVLTGDRMYLQVDNWQVLFLSLMMIAFALAGSVYPTLRATRIDVAEVIRQQR